MKKKDGLSLPAIGGSSLLVIFSVLCLTVFSLLSLNTALSEQRLSQAYREDVQQWYAADLQAQELFAKLRSGETVPGVDRSGGQYAYSLPISGHQTLQVVLRENGGSWEVISWRATAHPEDGDSNLPVWQGLEG